MAFEMDMVYSTMPMAQNTKVFGNKTWNKVFHFTLIKTAALS